MAAHPCRKGQVHLALASYPHRSRVRAEAPPRRVAAAAEVMFDAPVEESPGRRRLAESVENGGGHIVVQVLACLAERNAQDTRVVIVGDAINHRGSVETVCPHVDWSADLHRAFPSQRQGESPAGQNESAVPGNAILRPGSA